MLERIRGSRHRTKGGKHGSSERSRADTGNLSLRWKMRPKSLSYLGMVSCVLLTLETYGCEAQGAA